LQDDDPRARDQAAARIWQRYFPSLLQLAERQLARRVRQRVDGEDVLQDMYNSFCQRRRRGQFELANRDALWALLAKMTVLKARKSARKATRQRRDVRREERPAAHRPGQDDAEYLAQLDGRGPTPDEAAAFAEEVERRLEQLSPGLRQVALLRLSGYSQQEIAGKAHLDCSVRTVERKVRMIKQQWASMA
jgi:DNA-directed RNA polymerase specialized sigma24 family protein